MKLIRFVYTGILVTAAAARGPLSAEKVDTDIQVDQ